MPRPGGVFSRVATTTILVEMPTAPEGSPCAFSSGSEAQLRKPVFHPRPRELDVIPEEAQVVHGGLRDGCPTPETCGIPADPFDYSACQAEGSPNSRSMKVERTVLALIEETYSGERKRVADSVSQLRVESRWELQLVAQILVEKTFAEPLYSEACAMLACTFQMYLPSVPRASNRQGKKVEKFMHALLDVFQTVFEDVFFNPCQQIEIPLSVLHDNCAARDRKLKERTTLQFAAHLHRWGLLGEKVISQMTQDLMDTGAVDVARELLQVVGIVLDHAGQGNLGAAPTL